MLTPVAITQFRGEYSFLSNFYRVQIVDPADGLVFTTVEHAYQAAKTTDLKWRQAIQRAYQPGQAKSLGRRVPLREDWKGQKLTVMRGLLKQKFSAPSLRRALLLTGDVRLIEGNYWRDTYWGICAGVGENHLGRLLMEIRADIAAQCDAR